MFVYQPILNALEAKEDKCADYVIGLISKGVYNSKLTSLHTAFLRNIKPSGNKMRMQFNYSAVSEQNNYVSKIVNAYIAFNLDDWPKKYERKVKSKNHLFGANNVAKQ